MARMGNLESTITSVIKAQKVLETQVFKKAEDAQRDPGRLPEKTENNPKGQVMAITTRSGLETNDPQPKVLDKGKQPMEEEPKEKENVYNPPPPYTPPLPLPTSRARAQLDKHFGKFLDLLNKLYINIPLLMLF